MQAFRPRGPRGVEWGGASDRGEDSPSGASWAVRSTGTCIGSRGDLTIEHPALSNESAQSTGKSEHTPPVACYTPPMSPADDPDLPIAALAAAFGLTAPQLRECLRIRDSGAAGADDTISEAMADRLDLLRGRSLSEILIARGYLPEAEARRVETAVSQAATVIRHEPTHANAHATAPSPAEPSPPAKRTLGRYEILRELGRGGGGTVYLAFDPSLKREVALKVLRGGFGVGADAVARFQREAEAAARLSHPHLVPIYDTGVTADVYYFTMEFVKGGSLADRLRAGPPLPRLEALRVLRDVALAVAHAHAHGIVHRDLKPENVLLDPGEPLHPKVADFGLAHLAEGGANLTSGQAVMGTPAHMAPEQAEGKTALVDAQSDVYSLGSMLYAVLLGRLPYLAAGGMEMLVKKLTGEPTPPREVLPTLPTELEELLVRALARDKSRRTASAQAFADEIGRAMALPAVVGPPPPRRFAVGDRLGKYEILRELRGDLFGIPYHARERLLGRDVVIQAIEPSFVARTDIWERTLAYDRIACEIRHPNLQALIEVFEEQGRFFRVLEFLKGEPVKYRLLEGERMETAQVVRFGRAAAEVLRRLHQRGLPFISLQTANLWITTGGHPVLRRSLYRSSYYLSPEELAGGMPDEKTDFWSLGLVLFDLAVGGRDRVEDPIEAVNARANELPVPLLALVRELLREQPGDRLADHDAILKRLESVGR